MTNNDELKLQIEIAGINYALCKLLPDCRFMDPPDGGSVTPLEQVSRMIADYRQRIEAMLAERDADKKLLAEQDARLVEYAHFAAENARRVAELEARTVSVKLPEPFTKSMYGTALFEHDDIVSMLANAGIKLEVGE